MNGAANLLLQLAPDHAPPPIGWWPPAPGWWILAALLIVAVVLIVLWLRSPLRRLRRAALQELQAMQSTDDDTALAQALEQLARRYAVARYGRAQVARLSGRAWIDFVCARGGDAWAGAPGLALLQHSYGHRGDSHRQQWLAGVRGFVRHRRRDPRRRAGGAP
ncbi:DUF4381 domain-containing protein [Sinimarinibacterium sp. CAU 1509]|nr:DUF4381 domain-containing protein [Sinimarinibacterium sp. CAU 1509]